MEEELYNFGAAAKDLRKLSLERAKANCDGQLSTFSKNANGLAASQILASENPLAWCLTTRPTTDLGEVEEIVLHIQGMLVGMDLPPISKARARDTPDRQRKYLKQSIALAGLGEEGFHNSVDSIASIHDLFSRQFKESELEPWYPSKFRSHSSVDIANRYFSPRGSSGSHADCVPFDPAMDPQGVLQGMAGSTLTHTAENAVAYYERLQPSNRMVQALPSYFRVGDIVEAQVSFKVVPLKAGKRKMLVVLRAIALMDGAYSKNAGILRSKRAIRPPLFVLKRKIGYFNEEEQVRKTSEGIANMEV